MQEPNGALHSHLAEGDLAGAPVTDAERSLLKFVELLTLTAYKTTDADVEALRALGWTEPQIAECVYITALFAFFNRVADAFGLADPNYFDNPPPSPPGQKAP